MAMSTLNCELIELLVEQATVARKRIGPSVEAAFYAAAGAVNAGVDVVVVLSPSKTPSAPGYDVVPLRWPTADRPIREPETVRYAAFFVDLDEWWEIVNRHASGRVAA